MKKLGYGATSIAILFTIVAGSSAQSQQVKVAIDPRSAGETEAELLSPGFSCPGVSIVRDESEAAYIALAGETQSWGFLHYFIAVNDKHGKVVFSANKRLAKNALKAFCQFMNTQK